MDHKPDIIIIDYVDYLRAPSKGKFQNVKMKLMMYL
jgi:hypothetical protein